ncbi:MAG TPA: hypothetical protein VFQ12_03975 [Thermoleophilaceae bacterium]|nr:hypothetical protein [Thermoleophilaceae bacterium]
MGGRRHGVAWSLGALLAVLATATLVAGSAGPAQSRSGLPAATVKARKAFFGAANVDRRGGVQRDRVILSWFGVSSLAASFGGHVALLDTYINQIDARDCTGPQRPTPKDYVPTSYPQLVALRPEAIFIGHEHFDHQCRSGELLLRTGARLVGLPRQCQLARRQAREYARRSVRIHCARTLAADSAFGARREIRPLGRDVPVTVVRNLHSGPASQPPNNSGGAESLLYRFRVGRFSLVWNDTNGPLRENAPRLLRVLRALPATDVQFGASLGLNLGEHGYRDAIDYSKALRAKDYYAIHQDFGSTDGSSRGQLPRIRREFAARPGLRTRLHWLQDPGDYVEPIVFRIGGRRWR